MTCSSMPVQRYHPGKDLAGLLCGLRYNSPARKNSAFGKFFSLSGKQVFCQPFPRLERRIGPHKGFVALKQLHDKAHHATAHASPTLAGMAGPGLFFLLHHGADIDAGMRREIHLGDCSHIDVAVGAKFVRVFADQRQESNAELQKSFWEDVEIQAFRRKGRQAARCKIGIGSLLEGASFNPKNPAAQRNSDSRNSAMDWKPFNISGATSPTSPRVAQTRYTSAPREAYSARVPPIPKDSSSGWANTAKIVCFDMEGILPFCLTKFQIYSIMQPLWFCYGSIMEASMVAITVKNIPETLYERVKERAKANHRSINNELITILEQSVMLQPINVAETLEQTRRIRELTAHYIITDDELTRMKNEGRE